MKKILTITFIIFCSLCLSCCSSNYLKRPDNTNLEFWIAENVENYDFSSFTPKYGIMGGQEYYGAGYTPTYDENNQQIDPARCVIYTVTSYPDYSSNKSHVTRITITDPSVTVYGLTINSSDEEVKEVLEENGFKLDSENRYKNGKFWFYKSNGSITLRVEVENKFGIVF